MTHSPSHRRLLHHSIELLEARIAPAIVTGTLPLSSLDSAHGIKIIGPALRNAGYAVSAAGDLNADGVPDFIVAAPGLSGQTGDNGEVFVVFGQPGLNAPGTFDPTTLDGSLGFAIIDNAAGTHNKLGLSVRSAGDVNGDGVGDLIVGEPYDGAGAVFVVFGHKDAFPPVINVNNADETSYIDGTHGFKIQGETAGDLAGYSVGATDFNGDGLSDLVIGALQTGSGGSGAVYVVFGQTSFPAVFKLSSLNGLNGGKITGETANDNFGFSVNAAGDLNHDGRGDIIIGAPQRNSDKGAAYVVQGFDHFASSSVGVHPVALFTATGAAAGDQVGFSVSGAGDVDGDGTPDLLVGAPGVNSSTGAAYVLPGPAHGNLYSTFPFVISGQPILTGEAAGAQFGYSVASGGDFNGDGFADLIVGAPSASGAGASYVFFGKAGGLTGTIAGSSLTGANGFKITGAQQGDAFGASVSSVGDVNGDGYADLLAGAPSGPTQGAAYLVFGGPSGLAVGPVGTAVHLLNGVGQFNDVDGDLVTVKLKTQILAGNFDLLVKSGANPLAQLLGLEIGSEFEGSDLSITVKKAPGGDGRVNVGFIDAHGVDLGAVTVMGDLGKIVAGSGGTKLAFKSLTVDSLGAFGGTTEDTGSDHTSVLTGSVGPVKILGDVRDAILDVLPTATAGSGKIGTLTIGGSVIGGRFNALGDINAVSIGPVKIGGSIVGGAGSFTGEVLAGSYSTITVGGSIVGSSGASSGLIYSGVIGGLVESASGAVGVVKIGGGFFGGSGDGSAQLVGTTFAAVSIGGGLSGGAGAGSGSFLGTTSSTVTVGGSLIGGAGADSGSLEVGHLGNVTVHGDQIGGDGNFSGCIFSQASNGSIGKVSIGGSQIGGSAADAFILASGANGSIAGVMIAGDARGGSAPFSGGILAAGKVGPVAIKGSVLGQASAPYTIRGGGALTGATSLAIASITVGGNFEHALVLGGYGLNNAQLNGHAQIGAITVGRDWIASSVLAGVKNDDSLDFVANGFDRVIDDGGSTAIASIASVTIKGRAMGSIELGDHFGIEAQQIGFVSIRGVKLALTPGATTDTGGIAVGVTPDFVVREV